MTDAFTLTPAEGVHVVRTGDAVIAETSNALVLNEPGLDPVVYFPREDVGMEFLDVSETRTTCPHKGEATHYSYAGLGQVIEDAAWSYLSPVEGAEAIAGMVAFYADKLAVEQFMQAYYRQWSFRHPGPADLQAVLEKETGRDLDWLFDQILNSDRKMDYALQKAKPQGKGTRLYLRNRGRIAGPVLLSGWQEDRITYSAVLPGFSGRATHDLPLRTLGLFPPLEPLQLSILPRLENDRHTRLFLTPALGWNNYDKTMLGAAVYSSFFPPSRFQFALVPLYAFGSRSLAGMGEVAWRMFPRANAIRQIEISAQGRLFHYDDNGALGYRLKYGRLVPKLRLDLGRANNRPFSHALEARAILLWKQEPLFSDEEAYSGLTWNADQIFELAYEGQNGHVLRPFEFRAALEHQTYELEGQKRYTKLSLEWRQGWMYLRDRYLRVRWFGGFFLDNTQRKVDAISLGAFNLAQRGPTDYRFDHLWLGRTDERGLWSQQVARMDGGLRLPLPAGRREGRSRILGARCFGNQRIDKPDNGRIILDVQKIRRFRQAIGKRAKIVIAAKVQFIRRNALHGIDFRKSPLESLARHNLHRDRSAHTTPRFQNGKGIWLCPSPQKNRPTCRIKNDQAVFFCKSIRKPKSFFVRRGAFTGGPIAIGFCCRTGLTHGLLILRRWYARNIVQQSVKISLCPRVVQHLLGTDQIKFSPGRSLRRDPVSNDRGTNKDHQIVSNL